MHFRQPLITIIYVSDIPANVVGFAGQRAVGVVGVADRAVFRVDGAEQAVKAVSVVAIVELAPLRDAAPGHLHLREVV